MGIVTLLLIIQHNGGRGRPLLLLFIATGAAASRTARDKCEISGYQKGRCGDVYSPAHASCTGTHFSCRGECFFSFASFSV